MIKVLYIADSLKQRFGVTSVITNYIGHINDNNIKIDVLAYDNSEQAIIEKLKSFGSNVYLMPQLSLRNLFKFVKFIKSFFKEHDYQIVHSHFNQIDSIVFPIAKHYGVRHCISHSHNTQYSDNFFKGIRNYLLCLPLPYIADTWVACSDLAGNFLYGNNFGKSNKKLIVNNAINTYLYAFNYLYREEIRDEFNIANDEIVIGNIGSLKKQKNQEFLIDIFVHLVNDSKRMYKLLIVGDGELKEKLKKKTIELGLEKHVIFVGVRTDTYKFYSAFDLFALPSLYEGLPVVGIEAQTNGLPCFFSDKITKEVNIHNVTYLPIDDTDIWVKDILNFDLNDDKRSIASKFVSENGFNIDVEANKLARFYLKLL